MAVLGFYGINFVLPVLPLPLGDSHCTRSESGRALWGTSPKEHLGASVHVEVVDDMIQY